MSIIDTVESRLDHNQLAERQYAPGQYGTVFGKIAGPTLHMQMKSSIAARMLHNLSLDQMERLEAEAKKMCHNYIEYT